MVFQPINDIVALCVRFGVTDAILSPGSRCAPLTLAFSRHPEINVRTISDERSAAFIALGIAIKSRKPVVLVCTSGTAVLNYAPAVAEAFYQNIPLLVLTADRPAELIDQQDGQTIHQKGVFGKHVKKSFSMSPDYQNPETHAYVNQVANEALNLITDYPKGPVHINIPFREPFYPEKDERFIFSKNVHIIQSHKKESVLSERTWSNLYGTWKKASKIMIIAGQGEPGRALQKSLAQIKDIPVLGDIISNVHMIPENVAHADLILSGNRNELNETLTPDLLITFGNSTISKNLKLFLRKNKPGAHWHIRQSGHVADPYQTLTKIVRGSPDHFFEKIKTWPISSNQPSYERLWRQAEEKALMILNNFIPNLDFGELYSVYQAVKVLPSEADLHLANSMSVRLANYIGLTAQQSDIIVYANRGTSGIDGCSSTAVGTALASGKPTFLITGDLGFFYDRNAFWHNYDISNLHIVLLNNHAGGIFGLIDGPANQPELEELFETRQKLTAKNTAQDFGFTYFSCANAKDINNQLSDFVSNGTSPKLLEIETDKNQNKALMSTFKEQMSGIFERDNDLIKN